MKDFSDFPLVVRHPKNTVGRDFVVGDLHGCRSMLEDLLAHVQFDASIDRVFSTGDLVDRGPDSLGTLRLLQEPWFHAVLGNHDAMLLAYMRRSDDPVYAKAFVYNGGCDWTSGIAKDDLEKAADFLMDTPFIRVIGESPEDRFQVLHAERVSFDEEDSLSDEELDHTESTIGRKFDDTSRWITGYDMYGTWYDRLLWGRSVRQEMMRQASDFAPEITRTFVGHTITVGKNRHIIHQYAGHIFLDTGAFAATPGEEDSNRFGLTLWDAHANSGVTLSTDGFHKVALETI